MSIWDKERDLARKPSPSIHPHREKHRPIYDIPCQCGMVSKLNQGDVVDIVLKYGFNVHQLIYQNFDKETGSARFIDESDDMTNEMLILCKEIQAIRTYKNSY